MWEVAQQEMTHPTVLTMSADTVRWKQDYSYKITNLQLKQETVSWWQCLKEKWLDFISFFPGCQIEQCLPKSVIHLFKETFIKTT